jgi:hypothetical protein
MDFDGAALIAGLVVSAIGFVCFSYGKKMSRPPQLCAGVVLMGFPYFVSSALLITLIAAALLFGLWLLVNSGY